MHIVLKAGSVINIHGTDIPFILADNIVVLTDAGRDELAAELAIRGKLAEFLHQLETVEGGKKISYGPGGDRRETDAVDDRAEAAGEDVAVEGVPREVTLVVGTSPEVIEYLNGVEKTGEADEEVDTDGPDITFAEHAEEESVVEEVPAAVEESTEVSREKVGRVTGLTRSKLKAKTVKELRVAAKELDIVVPRGTNEEELIDLIVAVDEAAEAAERSA